METILYPFTYCTSVTSPWLPQTPHLLVLFLLGLQRFASLVQKLLLLSQSFCPPAQLHLFIQKLRLEAPELLLRVDGLLVIQCLKKKNIRRKAF